MSMRDLKKISDVLVKAQKGEQKRKQLFGHIQGEKTQKLLKGVVSDIYPSDQEAAQAIYHQPEGADKRYLMLKSRLKKKMIEEAFFVNPHNRKRSPYESYLNEAYRNLSIAKTFLSAGLRKEAMDLIKPLYTEARHYSFTEIILSTSRMLRYHASLHGTKDDLLYYDRVIEETKAELDAEIFSERVIEELNLETRFSYSNRKDLVKETAENYEKLKTLSARFRSHILRLNTYRIGIRYHEYMQDFAGMITVCESCETYLRTNPQFEQNSRYAEMALFKMDACLHLKDYKKGQEHASVCSRYFTRGYPNWFVFMEYFFLLCLQTRNYEASIHVFNEVTRHAKFRNVNPERKEKWKLFEAYLNFAVPKEMSDGDFKLYKFVNELPIYNRDKRGYNLSIMIAQFMLLLRMKDLDRLLLKRDSFKVYFNRYVKKKYNYRSYYFSKMLMTVLRYNFDAEKTKHIAHKFLVKLKIRNNRYHGDLESLEVIPYEQLWDEVIHLLQANAEGSKYFIKPQARRGRHQKQPSKNLQAALRFKAQARQEAMQTHGIA